MIGKIVLFLATLALTRAQIPSLGFCPEYVPMANFNMSKFLGVWYEAERYFQLTEVVSRCVMANYTLSPDGKFRVSNEVTNRFTGIKRILEGEIKKAISKSEEGKLTVKYTIPLTPETKYSILETDYESYAVMWSCSGVGPFHTQNAWVLTRERLAPGTVLQKAYAVLDKYKISKTFFIKTDQEDCAYLDATPPKPAETETQSENKPEAAPEVNNENVRSVVPDAPEVIVEMQNAKDKETVKQTESVDNVKMAVNTVPERIIEVVDNAQEDPSIIDTKLNTKKTSEPVIEEADDESKRT